MSEPTKRKLPFKALGNVLKSLRQRRKENVAEVAGAVEIETDTLNSFEQGSKRPSEDILALLITHFDVAEEAESKLWELAGYEQPALDIPISDTGNHSTHTVMVMPMDLRIVYTDSAHITVNKYGLVMNFMQTTGGGNQPMAISRIGMSREHAKNVLEMLQKTLSQSEPKALPAPKAKSNKTKK